MKMVTATLTGKAQITVPKAVRELLGMKTCGEVLGFLLDEAHHSVRLTRVNLVPAEEEFSEEEYRQLLGLAKEPGGKTFAGMKALLKDLKKT